MAFLRASDLEAWADDILGFDSSGRRPPGNPWLTKASIYTERDLRRKAQREIPYGDQMELFGLGPDGRVFLGEP